MKAIKAYFRGWAYVFSKWKMWALIFVLNVLLAVLCTSPLVTLLDEELGNSAILEDILPDFDYAAYNDIVHQFGEGVSVILDQALSNVILFLLLAIFTMGGILSAFQKPEQSFSFRDFWSSGAYYFWRILRLTIYFTIVQLFLIAMAVSIFQYTLKGGPGTFGNEYYIIKMMAIIFPIYLMLALLVSLIQDYAKIYTVSQDSRWLFQAIWNSFALVFKNIGSTLFLYLLNLLTLGIIAYIYWLYNKTGKISSVESLVVAFVIGQLFIIFRIGIRLVNLGGASYLFSQIFSPNSPTVPDEIKASETLIATTISDPEESVG